MRSSSLISGTTINLFISAATSSVAWLLCQQAVFS